MKRLKDSFTSELSLKLVLVGAVASYLDAALIVSLGIALPIWKEMFALNTWEIGGISTLLTLMIALGSFTGGWLSDRFGRIKVFNLDIIFVAIGTLIIAVAPDFQMLLVGIVISGLCSGADLPTSLAVISERMSVTDYGKAITITQQFWIFGIIFSQLLGSVTAGLSNFSPTVIFLVLSSMAFINWCIRVFSSSIKTAEKVLTQNKKEEKTDVSRKSVLHELLRNPQVALSVLTLTLFYLFWNLPANTWGSFINYFLVASAHQSQLTATLVAAVANILGFFVNMWYIKKSDSECRYQFMAGGIFGAFTAFALAATFSSIWYVFTIMYFVYSISTVFCGESLYKIWSQMLYPTDMRASFTGFSYGVVRLLTSIFALITPTLMDYSPSLLMWILATCVLGYGVCAWFTLKLIRRFNIIDPTLKVKNEVSE